MPLLKILKQLIEGVCLNASIKILKIEIYPQMAILEEFIFLVMDERVYIRAFYQDAYIDT